MSTRFVKKILLSVMLCCVSSIATAEAWHTGTVKWVYPQADGEFVITFTVDSPSCTNDNNPKYMRVTPGAREVTVDAAKKMFATVLLAFAMEKPITVAFDETVPHCYISRLFVSQ